MERTVVWNKRPSQDLAKALKRISQESYQNAELVETAILTKLEDLKEHPEKYPPDKFKRDNFSATRSSDLCSPSSFR